MTSMIHSTLISTSELADRLDEPDWRVVDCRFSLDDTGRGRRDYLQAHVPGAAYAHLDEDLSGPVVPGKTGRHPLPAVDAVAKRLGQWGIGAGVQVVAYDDNTGGVAARLWWMLRWLGHDGVAVLDGGWKQWSGEGRQASVGEEQQPAPRVFTPHPQHEMVVDASAVLAMGADPAQRLIDSRSQERYRGEQEPFDPVAGHIPGAVCAPYEENLNANGLFRSAGELRARFEAILGGLEPARAVFYCGSGVTAAHNLLAMAHAGLGDARLYAGSWSEWIADPRRPVARQDG
jgi:thiosulfate/3-mercaptopyruvate sulfurtransferase